MKHLEAAWNSADSKAFAAEFAEDADFVNVRGQFESGRSTIGDAHAKIWAGIYAGSSVRYSLLQLRQLAPDVLLAHLEAHLHVPSGPLAGDIDAIPSMVLVRQKAGWQIASFHNTARPHRA